MQSLQNYFQLEQENIKPKPCLRNTDQLKYSSVIIYITQQDSAALFHGNINFGGKINNTLS
jgi:hypothetical protein